MNSLLEKGHKYATVVVDLDTKRVIWVGKGKTVREVNRFFKLCGTEGCKQIKAVAMDQNADLLLALISIALMLRLSMIYSIWFITLEDLL